MCEAAPCMHAGMPTFITTMDVPQKKKGEISTSALATSPSWPAQCSTAENAPSGKLLLHLHACPGHACLLCGL